jgi:hypothetical protein
MEMETIVFQLNTEVIKVEPHSEEETSPGSSLTEVNFIDMKDPLLLVSPLMKIESSVSVIVVHSLSFIHIQLNSYVISFGSFGCGIVIYFFSVSSRPNAVLNDVENGFR